MEITSGIFVLLGTLVGAGTSIAVQHLQGRQAIKIVREQMKSEFMAENAARRLLEHQSFESRSLKALQNALGGFEDDELRKILVRAGAVRFFRDGEERWNLIEREPDRINKLRRKEGRPELVTD